MIEPNATQIAQACGIVLAAFLLSLVLRRLLVRALDRGDADKNIGRLTGRFLSLVLVDIGVVYAFGFLGIRLGPILGALGVGGIALAIALQTSCRTSSRASCCRFADRSVPETRSAWATSREPSAMSTCVPSS